MKNETIRCKDGSSYLLFGDGTRKYRLLAFPDKDGRPMTHFKLLPDGDQDGAFLENDVSGIKVQGRPNENEFSIVMRSYLRRVEKRIQEERTGSQHRNELEHLAECMKAVLQEGVHPERPMRKSATAA